MKSLRRYAPLLGLLLFGALVWLGIYAYQDGFTKKWRKLIVKEFAKHDLTISFDTLTIDPFQGLVANKVVLLEGDTEQEIARVSQARLDVNLGKLIQSKRFLERIELDSANVSLPYDRKDPNSKRVEFKELQATIILPDGEIEIVNAETNFYGLRLNLTGDLQRPKEGSGEIIRWEPDKIRAARPLLENLVKHLAPLRSQRGQEPVLNMAISGDLARPQTLRLEAQLIGKGLHYGDLELRDARAQAAVTDRLFSLDGLTITDTHGGRFDANGDFPLKGKREATLSLNSSIDIGKLLPNMAPSISQLAPTLTLHQPPLLSMGGTLQLDQPFKWSSPPAKLIGHIKAQDFQVGKERFERLQADFHVDRSRFFARNIRIEHPYGKATGKIIHSPTDGTRYEMALGMDPTLLQQLPLPEEASTFLNRWEFRPNSGVEVNLFGERKPEAKASWKHHGDATLTECRFETGELEKLHFNFALTPQAYDLSGVEAKFKSDPARLYSGGTVRAERLNILADSGITTLSGVNGSIDPGQVVRCFDPTTADRLDAYHFSLPPEIRISQGTIDTQNGTQTSLQAEVKAPGDLKTALLGKEVTFTQPRFGLHFLQDRLLVRLDHTGLLSGHLTGSGEVQHLHGSRDYTAEIRLTELNFQELAALYFPDHRADGQLSGSFAWRGRGTDLAAIAGKGEAHLTNTQVIDVPILSPLSALISRVVGETKVSHGVIRDLGGPFQLQSQTLSLDPFIADLGSYSIKGNGTVELPTSAIDMQVSLSNESTSGNLLDILYEIFGTYQCSGTLEKPKWTMVSQIDPTEAIQEAVEDLSVPDQVEPHNDEQATKFDAGTLIKELLKRQRQKDQEEEQ